VSRRVAALAALTTLVALVVTGALTLAAPDALAAPVLPATDHLTLRTPTNGGGAHPILRWQAARAADHYLVVVQTPDGDPFWTWQGAATRVRLGGGPLHARASSAGARLETKKVWFVLAFGADGAPVASSTKRSLRP